jgi:hypothetical protein
MTRTEAAHTNGALSNGPVTPEGKARSSRNATKHGMNSKDVVLPGESQEEFDALLGSYVQHHLPAGDIERSLVFEMAAARWRLRRLFSMETAVFEQEMTRVANDTENPVEPDHVMAVAFDRLAHGKGLSNIHRYETRLHKAYNQAQQELLRTQELSLQRQADHSVQNEPDEDIQVNHELSRILESTRPGFRSEAFMTACVTAVAAHQVAPQADRRHGC